MFQVTRATEYALLLLVSLEKSQAKPLSLRKISQERNLPLKYLEKIAGLLRENNILASKEGVKGGYFLAKPAKKISLKEIIEAVEGKKGLVSCLYGTCHLEKNCLHKNIWLRLQNILNKELGKLKLSDLINFKKTKK